MQEDGEVGGEEPVVMMETREYVYDSVMAPDGYRLEWMEERYTSRCTLFRKQFFVLEDPTFGNENFVSFLEE